MALTTVFLPAVAFRRSAQAVLADRLSAVQASRIWRQTQERQAELSRSRPRHSMSVNLLIKYMEWDAALYQAALAEGLSSEEAGQLIEATNWRSFESMSALAFKVSRLRSARLLIRVEWLLDLMFKLVFAAPFKRNKIPANNQVAFDVTRCPLAEYFRDLGIPELTKYAACSLDHYMAAQWGMTLKRTQTIAEEAPLCDFRFRMKEAE
mgnify:CR=1 FL=1